jgi:hypothetical protein
LKSTNIDYIKINQLREKAARFAPMGPPCDKSAPARGLMVTGNKKSFVFQNKAQLRQRPHSDTYGANWCQQGEREGLNSGYAEYILITSSFFILLHKTSWMETLERQKLLKQILWDYNIPEEEIEAVFKDENKTARHYNREMLFLKIIESYPWFTVIQIFSPAEIQNLLSRQVISKLRSPSLRKKYEFVQERLSKIIPAAR